MKNRIMFLIVSIGLFALPLLTQAQNGDSVSLQLRDGSMTVEGTSTIHDWEADVTEMDFSFEADRSLFEKDTLQQGDSFSSLTLVVPVEGLDSGKGRMDNKMYDALKEKDHPEIRFELSEATIQEISDNNAFTLSAKGTLTIAGTTKDIELEVEGTRNGENEFQFKASKDMKMTDFDVDPPTAMLGSIRAGDEITVSFDLTFSRS